MDDLKLDRVERRVMRGTRAMELTSKGIRAACLSDATGTKASRIFGATA